MPGKASAGQAVETLACSTLKGNQILRVRGPGVEPREIRAAGASSARGRETQDAPTQGRETGMQLGTAMDKLRSGGQVHGRIEASKTASGRRPENRRIQAERREDEAGSCNQ